MRLFPIEDDPSIQTFLRRALNEEGHEVDIASSAEDELQSISESSHDLLIVDLTLPGMDGLEFIERCRGRGLAAPVLILSARRSVDQRVLGLEKGGDDYLTKPFALPELLARVRVLLRRGAPAQAENTAIRVEDLEIDLLRREVRWAGRSISLTTKEFDLLVYLCRNVGRVLTRSMILDRLWNIRFNPATNVVGVHLHRLCAKIDGESERKLIHTIRGRVTLSALAGRFRGTAAWRLSVPVTLAFAAGTGAAFLIAYSVVARGIGERSDAWLVGESELLAQVALSAPSGDLHAKMVEEVAELAAHEIPPAPGDGDGEPNERQPVFFLLTSKSGEPEVWVGPQARDEVASALRRTRPPASDLFTVDVPGWDHPFRVAAHDGENGETVYLGLIDSNARALLRNVQRTFLWLWSAMLIFGSLVSLLGAHRILRRVEQVTETASRIGEENLHDRVPAAAVRDEIARLATTFNQMLSRIEISVKQIRSVTDAVAHDLRSPVTAIRGHLEMALTGAGEGDTRGSVESGPSTTWIACSASSTRRSTSPRRRPGPFD